MHLHFTQSLEPLQGAGLGYAALGLHGGMLAGGMRSVLLSTRAREFDASWDGVEMFERQGPGKAFYAPDLAASARRHVADAQWVHGHGFYVYPNWVVGASARTLRKPLVYHAHGFLDPWILRRSKGKKRLAHWLFENANFKHAGLWRAVSPKEERQIRDFGIRAPVIVLPNGVDLPPDRTQDDLDHLAAVLPKRKPHRLAFLSRIHPKKGLDLLVGAWAQLNPALKRDWELAIFGPDENGYLAEVQAMARSAGIQEEITFYGPVSGPAKEAALRSADLFVLPSYSEGFPMAVLEASAHGLPVVLTDECNFPELTEAGGGWQCQPSAESLTPALAAALACGDSERAQRGAAGRDLVARDYTWPALAARLHEACREMLKS